MLSDIYIKKKILYLQTIVDGYNNYSSSVENARFKFLPVLPREN